MEIVVRIFGMLLAWLDLEPNMNWKSGERISTCLRLVEVKRKEMRDFPLVNFGFPKNESDQPKIILASGSLQTKSGLEYPWRIAVSAYL